MHRVLNKFSEYIYFRISKSIISYAFMLHYFKLPKTFSVSLKEYEEIWDACETIFSIGGDVTGAS